MEAQRAIQLCSDEFPDGLERLIEILGITVEAEDLSVDGWCYQTPDGSRFVRLNKSSPSTRQRFTLAHEIAHFLLINNPGGLFFQKDIFNPNSQDEELANDLASKLLFPEEKVLEAIKEPYVDGKIIKHLSKMAGASEIAAALRIYRLTDRLGLEEVTIAHIKDGEVVWKRSAGATKIDSKALLSVFREASDMPCSTNRIRSRSGKYFQISSLVNPYYPFVFLHSLNEVIASRPFLGRSRKELEGRLFNQNNRFRSSLNGMISGCKKLVVGMGPEEAVNFLLKKYADSYVFGENADWLDLFWSDDCHDYLLIRLSEYI